MYHTLAILCAMTLTSEPLEGGLVPNLDPRLLILEAIDALDEAAAEMEASAAEMEASEDEQDMRRERAAGLLLQIGAVDDAVSTINDLHDSNTRDSMSIPLASYYARQRQAADVRDVIGRLPITDSFGNNYRLMAIDEAVDQYMDRMEWSAAVELIQELSPRDEHESLLRMIAAKCITVGDYECAQKLIDRVSGEQRVRLLCELATTATARGKDELAQTAIDGARETASAMPAGDARDAALQKMAAAYAAMKRHADVIRSVEDIHSELRRGAALVNAGMKYAAGGEAERAVAVFRRVQSEYPGTSPFAIVQRLAASGHTSHALDCVIGFAPDEKRDLYLRRGVFDQRLHAGDYHEALQCATFMSEPSHRLRATLWVLEAYGTRPGNLVNEWRQRAIRECELLTHLIQPPLARAQAHAKIAALQYTYGMSARADHNITAALQLLMDAEVGREAESGLVTDDLVRLAIGKAYMAAGQCDKAIETLEGTRDRQRGVTWKISFLLEAGRHEQAYDEAQAALHCGDWGGADLVFVLEMAARNGAIAWAVAKARAIESPWLRARALLEVAEGVIEWVAQRRRDRPAPLGMWSPAPSR